MSDIDALQGFLGKWRARWPEWAIAETFIPEAQREVAQAWLALREEISEAAWGGKDPRPGDAKLGWWTEELMGWSRGARRHPLGQVLQKRAAPWAELARALPSLAATREPARDMEAGLQRLVPYADAVSAVAQQLFKADVRAPVHNVAVSLMAERLLLAAADGDGSAPAATQARQLLAVWPQPNLGTRPGRVHAALVRGRLARRVKGRQDPLPRFAALLVSWRAARG